jgi:predicted RecA/RadA family phage recombinase
MADWSPKFKPGQDITLTAGATITGGQLLQVSAANTVIPTSAAGPTWIGVAAQDAANGEKVVVRRGGVAKLISSGAIAAGARVIPGAAGVVVTIGAGSADHTVGTALEAAAGNLVLVAMDR